MWEYILQKPWDRVPIACWDGGLMGPTVVLFPYQERSPGQSERVGQADILTSLLHLRHGSNYIASQHGIIVGKSTTLRFSDQQRP
jgi:hypothetical protein